MLLVRTYVAPSTIQGTGLFAAEPIAKGTCMWRFEPTFDRFISFADLEKLPEAARECLEEYGYEDVHRPGGIVMNGDNACFINHSPMPNTDNTKECSYALRDIAEGEEITCDYCELNPGYATLPYVAAQRQKTMA